MQMDEAARLRKQWERAGSPACDHPRLEKEYYLGSQTGDKVCTSCGETFTRGEWEILQAERDQGAS
jgi:hypothetical protein